MIGRLERGDEPDFPEFVDAFGGHFPLLNRLGSTQQDPIWHAEGDVGRHTAMVLQEAYKQLSEADFALSSHERLAVILGALFHDIAKPVTTRQKMIAGKERIVAPRHADQGRSYLAYKLSGLGLAPTVVDMVLALVGHHHDPKHLVIDTPDPRAFWRLGRLANPGLLYLLEQADMRGRICEDRQEQIEYIDLFRLYAQDSEIWNGGAPHLKWKPFIDDALSEFDEELRQLTFATALRDAEAGTISTPEEAIARSYRFREGFSNLVVLCGPSGSGKTTWALQNLEGYGLISMDDLREELTGNAEDQSKNGQVLQLARERLREYLRAKRPVIWDATNLRRDFRRVPIELGFDYGAYVRLVVFQLPEKLLASRIAARERRVTDGVLEKQLSGLQFPYADEAHELEIIRPHLD